jgi:SecD/SecF fusion protein
MKEKQKKWQLFLIIAVVALTFYHIFPTIFFYSKPLKRSVDEKIGLQVAQSIAGRVNALEEESISWLKSYCDNLHIKPLQIKFDEKNRDLITLRFKNANDGLTFRKFFTKAGALIAFAPAQLSLHKNDDEALSTEVVVQRKIATSFDQRQPETYFEYSPKFDENRSVTRAYQNVIGDRLLELSLCLAGPSENGETLLGAIENRNETASQDLLVRLAQNLQLFTQTFGEQSSISKRYFASFTQIDVPNRDELARSFISALENLRDSYKIEILSIQEEVKKAESEGAFLEPSKHQRLELLSSREKVLAKGEEIAKRNLSYFSKGEAPLSEQALNALILEGTLSHSDEQRLLLSNRNVFIDGLTVDWPNEKIYLTLHPDLLQLRKKSAVSQAQLEKENQFLYSTIAFASRITGEKISPNADRFEISLSELADSKSFLSLNLSSFAASKAQEISDLINENWMPKHPELNRKHFHIYDYETYLAKPKEEKQLCLIVYSPVLSAKAVPKGFKPNSVYVIAKGLNKILERMQKSEGADTNQFLEDFKSLQALLHAQGFAGFPGSSSLSKEFASDLIFENATYFQTLLKATREDFKVKGTKKYAILELSDVEQRILTENKIDTAIHEDLLKWDDDYRAARIGNRGTSGYDVPKPAKNLFFSNLKLSLKKYFRGDERKVIRWGLDLSGGKTVQIQLIDGLNRPVTNEADLKQGIDELYRRVNKMGVSEVNIRRDGNFITLDFPGSQGLSASELVKASSMYFHVVNEKFSNPYSAHADDANQFLQEVWNEAVVTNQKSEEEINAIAYKHLYGEGDLDGEIHFGRSEAAEKLLSCGLTLADPKNPPAISSNLNETYSKIAVQRSEDYSDWHGFTTPLLIVMRNPVLEGANLENIFASYDPSRGNYLSFGIKGSYARDHQKITPREDVHAWTTQYCTEKVQGTSLGQFSNGKGWRMAVLLNGYVISAPTLEQAVKDSAMIHGSFTQREINQLESDLRAGSLTFTPKIMSEKNVSPELGSKERFLGVLATIIALFLVFFIMVAYYRFAGLVASIAVIFNLLIMWAALQNIHASLSLAAIAGIILTVGMAVDANVLVFERIREEFAISGRIASAVHAGYKKAFSAIFDSNITTIIAALILLQFDSGPIKGFAISLIIGIASSMFTALFMTRYFFSSWIKNPANKKLTMSRWIHAQKFDFLKNSKYAFLFSAIILIAGAYCFTADRGKVMGMDFTGGFAVTLEVAPKEGTNYRQLVENALTKQGISSHDFQIRELSPTNHIRLFVSKNLFSKTQAKAMSDIENPKIAALISTLTEGGVELTAQTFENIENSWNEISGQMSSTMRNGALIGLLLSLLCILIYITFRFEFKYAISATLCIIHDVIFAVASIGILYACGVDVQIDLHTVAALMTIIGYSLNDTIIVFDRIREDVAIMRKSSFREIVNHALNTTLSRTLMTSITTLAVLIPLVLLGGSTIFGFALVMAIGVIFGTLSSLFVASPLLEYFHAKETKDEEPTIVVVK